MESLDKSKIMKDKADELWEENMQEDSIAIYEELIETENNILLNFKLGERLFEIG